MTMELTLNLIWLAIAVTAFVVMPKRSAKVVLAVAIVVAILFPIISASDDINAIQTFNDAVATLAVTIVLTIALLAIARLRAISLPRYAVLVATPSDPRSPPAR